METMLGIVLMINCPIFWSKFNKTLFFMQFTGIPTTIGSLPHLNQQEAVELILKYTPQLPAWPQLPKKSFKENMYVQFSENFPGIIINGQLQKIYVDSQKAFIELEKFYENYIANNIDYFAISEDYANGFYKLLSQLATYNLQFTGIKCQTIGPITFGLAIKNENGQPIFYDTQLQDAVIKLIIGPLNARNISLKGLISGL